MSNIPNNKKAGFILVIAVFLFILAGCGSSPKYSPSKASGSKLTVVNTAKKMLGVKYRYGGTNPSRGFDCSGLVQYSHKAAGVQLPRTTGQQYRASRPIQKRYLKPGDLVFFKTSVSRAVSHVGIYLGDGWFAHASSKQRKVTISHFEKEPVYVKRMKVCKRYLSEDERAKYMNCDVPLKEMKFTSSRYTTPWQPGMKLPKKAVPG